MFYSLIALQINGTLVIITRLNFCVSCKDSEKYDEDALNELEVYSNKIGGEDVVKILVATKLPLKTTIMDRAREMNINIVVLNNNIEKFKEELINIIKKKED